MRNIRIGVAVLISSTVLLLASLMPAKAELHFRGEHNRNRHELKRVYKNLPERVKSIDVTITQYTEEEWKGFRVLRPNIIGFYSIRDKEIYVVKDKAGNWRTVFLHELGHHLWYHGLKEQEKIRWTIFWIQNLDRMPRDYARIDPEEGWAECFAMTYLKTKPTFTPKVDKIVKKHIRSYFYNPNIIDISGRRF